MARWEAGSGLALETVRFDGSKEGEFAVVGTDGRALSIRVWPLASFAPEPFGIGARLAARIASAFESGSVRVRYSDGIAFFDGSEPLEIAATTTDGRFPNWRQIVPEPSERAVRVGREKFLRVVRAASATADEKRRVSLRFDANGLTATCVGAEIGTSEVAESFEIDGLGEGVSFGFDVDPENLRFLESWSAPSVEISSSDPVKPVARRVAGRSRTRRRYAANLATASARTRFPLPLVATRSPNFARIPIPSPTPFRKRKRERKRRRNPSPSRNRRRAKRNAPTRFSLERGSPTRCAGRSTRAITSLFTVKQVFIAANRSTVSPSAKST